MILFLLALELFSPWSWGSSCFPLAQLSTKNHWGENILLTSLCSNNQILSSRDGVLKLRKADAAHIEILRNRYRRIYSKGADLKLTGCPNHQVEMKYYQNGKEMAPIVLCPSAEGLVYEAFNETFYIESAGASPVEEAP